jgi:5-carboxyvanillate decarboxylase
MLQCFYKERRRAMKRIAIEEHFMTEDYLNYLRSRKDYPKREIAEDEKHQRIERIIDTPSFHYTVDPDVAGRRLVDMGERLKEMDKAGINMQLLSLSLPGVEPLDASDGITWAKKTNDELAEMVKEYPERFAGLAALPVQAPIEAADELERTVKQLGFKGANINSHIWGEYLDDKKYWVIFEKAEKLGVPIYLHPREPSPDMLKPYLNYVWLPLSMWGYGAETGLHAVRLICSGVFDEYPCLKIILGHLGEGLPFWQWRFDNKWQQKTPMAKNLRKKPSEYMKDNFFITTSGNFSQPALLCAMLTFGADNILFAVDYPYESSEAAVRFMDAASISASDKEKIYHLNAEILLAL